MPIDVVMPQMGESIAEGTIVKWLKKVGEKVERDEPLLEISTDKVDAEIPSPSSGTLTEIIAQEGQTVGVNTVVARIGADGEAAGTSAPPPQPAAEAAKPEPTPEPPAQVDTERPETRVDAPPVQAAAATEQNDDENIASLDERRRTKSSPLVRKIAQENNVDITKLQGSGVSGRVTKNDILDFLQQPKPATPAQQPAATQQQPQPAPRPPAMTFASGENNRIEPLSVMRKKIAQHMVLSKQTSAHVTTVFEVDFTAIDKLRRQYKEAYAERGAKLTFLPFVIQAVVAGLREFPIINASMDDASVIYHRDLNIGIAVALDWGLIVPIVKNADEKNILGLSKTINDLGERARTKKLAPDDVQGGTFTITNPGVYGGLFGTPIINQPQVAILGVGGVKKRPVVIETKDGDFIAIRSMCILSLTFDHRLIDGAVADQFMARVKAFIEAGQFTL
ncbi:MAG TPA: 2-oxoglutarate dehydrogenase, E2 component, dihydrolipoamide succinyltransferase [Thermoanaerobaculia bacterium]|jgi:2-oxoglutarate dehydrogenase E2 component (dihydrolipoamide succinyltransferase)|nr:2-oxoglutarate dehydrogenase, E2 component, dihydrolipoamide succinyltransferase [Thermoanaerobaculia bacterium]